MNPKEPSELTDEALLAEAKKIKPSPTLDAFFIGFLVGIIIFGVAANTWGFVAIIPLFLIYALLKKSKRLDALNKELAKRKLR